MIPSLITLATNIIGNWFLIRRLAWWGDLKIFFATRRGSMHCVAGRVSESLCQLFLKRFSKMIESGLEPMREKNGRSGDRTHAGSANPSDHRVFQRENRSRVAACGKGVSPPRVGSIPAATILLPRGFESRFEHF